MRIKLPASLILLSLVICLGVSAGCAKKQEEPKIEISASSEASFVESMEKPLVVLLLGSDSRSEDISGRSDSIILFKVDPKSGKSVIVSIPRDSKVSIPGRGDDKINAAMAYGGPQLAAKTIEDLLDVSIDFQVVTTFFAFSRIVNSLGGVEVNIPEAVNDPWATASFEAGRQRLDGKQALALARSRHVSGGDFTRMKNQQDILLSIWREHEGQSEKLADLFAIVAAVDGNVSSIARPDRMFILAKAILSIDPGLCEQIVLPGAIKDINAISYVVLDPAGLQQARKSLDEL